VRQALDDIWQLLQLPQQIARAVESLGSLGVGGATHMS